MFHITCTEPSITATHAARARRLAAALDDAQLKGEFERMAGDYEDIAEDLERGLIDIKHPEALPQQR